MKTWQMVAVLALSVAISAVGWLMSPGKGGKEEVGQSFVRRKASQPESRQAREVKIDTVAGTRRGGSFSFDDMTSGKDMSLSFGDDFGFEDEIKEKLSSVLQQIYDQYLAASNRDDRKAMLASIQRLLAKAAAGEKLPLWLKQRMIEGIKWVGGSALPELIAMAADADAEIASSSLDALQDLLWDFDTTPQQISDALCQVVKLSTDVSVIEPFVFEMNDMPTQLKVSTALMILDSGNSVAAQCLDENMSFIFDDFNGSVKTREDILNYASTHAESDAVESVSGNK